MVQELQAICILRYKLIILLIIFASCETNDNEDMRMFIAMSSSGTPQKVKVFILTGQSNSTGAALNADALAAEIALQSEFFIFQSNDDFANLDVFNHNNYAQNYVTHGLELGLASKLQGEDAYMIKKGLGSTSIDEHLVTGSVYISLKNNFLDPAIIKLDALGIDYELIMVYWQGEEDALLEVTADAWAAKFDTWVSLWQTNLGSDLRFRILEIAATERPFAPTINAAMNAKALTEPHLEVIPTGGLSAEIHYQYDNMKTASQLLLDSL